jgi:hypothetical protein
MSAFSFTRDDLARAAEAAVFLTDFESFILDRFVAYTQRGGVNDISGRPVGSLDSAQDDGGYGTWSVQKTWSLEPWVHQGDVRITHFQAGDRGPGNYDRQVDMPWDFVFGATEAAERYEQYLALKAEFEPNGGVA